MYKRQTLAISSATGGVDFGRVRGSAVWSGHGGCGRGIHGTFIFILSSSDDRSFVRRSRARAQEETTFVLLLLLFFLQKAPRKGRKRRARERKSRKYLVQRKKSWKSRLAFLPFFKKKVERNLLIEK